MRNYLWRIELLGNLRAVLNPASTGQNTSKIIDRFRTQKTASLLAYLAVQQKPQPREVLVELFWPENDPKAGCQNLRTTLSSLRKQLEPPGIAKNSVIVSTRSHIQLNPQTDLLPKVITLWRRCSRL